MNPNELKFFFMNRNELLRKPVLTSLNHRWTIVNSHEPKLATKSRLFRKGSCRFISVYIGLFQFLLPADVLVRSAGEHLQKTHVRQRTPLNTTLTFHDSSLEPRRAWTIFWIQLGESSSPLCRVAAPNFSSLSHWGVSTLQSTQNRRAPFFFGAKRTAAP